MSAEILHRTWQEAIRNTARIQRIYNEHLAQVDNAHDIPPLEEATPIIRELQKNLNELYHQIRDIPQTSTAGWKRFFSPGYWRSRLSESLTASIVQQQAEFNATTIHLLNELLDYNSRATLQLRTLLEHQVLFFQQITPWIDVKIQELRQEQNHNVGFHFGKIQESLEAERKELLMLAESVPAAKTAPITNALKRIRLLESELLERSLAQERQLQEMWFKTNQAIARSQGLFRDAQEISCLRTEIEEVKQTYLKWTHFEVPTQSNGNGDSAPDTVFPKSEGLRYVMFEEAFRGTSESLLERQKRYVPYFLMGPEPILDLGCGRGEFLKLMKEIGKNAYGVDTNQYNVSKLAEQGLSAFPEDILHHLQKIQKESIGGVFCAQVVEHLSPEQVYQMLTRLFFAMKSGSSIVIETVNPLCVFGYHHVYFKDPTHIFPVHPETMAFILQYAGFKNVQIHPITPVPENQKLPLPNGELEPNGSGEYISSLVGRLNDLLFSDIEYFATGYRP